MTRTRRQVLTAGMAATATTLLGTPLAALAQGAAANWPSKPVRIIVPNVPGGALDILARMLETELAKTWKQPIVVEFKPGAGTITGTDFVAKSAPDGYTLGILAVGVLGIQPALRKDMPFDTLRDLSGTMLVVGNILMSASPSMPFNDLAGLIAWGKANKGKLSYATAGAGSSMQTRRQPSAHHNTWRTTASPAATALHIRRGGRWLTGPAPRG